MKILSLTHARAIRDHAIEKVADAMTESGWSREKALQEIDEICQGQISWRTRLSSIQRTVGGRFGERGWAPPVELFEQFTGALEFISKTEQTICQRA